ncbi:unnamed protein product [Symbiodinium natans]|uniref:EF-hand domain-containing protein n=1 Tax=Symbiodinium natans TaxID=878477 RepID=A0A812LBJ0_9DINO|nr:unnamed protein product [Symbiodinium natans]
MAPSENLQPEEQAWQAVFERLCERFPETGATKVAAILRENNGHAGQAAAAIRDLGGTGKREVDPDDQEHVKTLLTSPVMFAAVCKENFRKFDANGDGVLSWTEVLPLVNSLYESFGLQPPREGNLRSFFDATDLNKDGVLSEREFKKFFECFLRYAFFDVVQKESANAKQVTTTEAKEEPEEKAEKEKPVEDRRPANPAVETRGGYERQDKAARTSQVAQGSPGVPFRVIAPHGISWRRSPDFNDRMDSSVNAGEVVKVLEQWVKTDRGWLPLHDARGKPLLQPAMEDLEGRRAPAGAAGPAFTACRREKKPKEADAAQPDDEPKLRSGEEDWKERLDRLQERFPMLSSGQVLQKLRAHQGHAGHTAAALRELMGRHGG